jgi:curli biogenesis system outer membrane secretion channel CsgG
MVEWLTFHLIVAKVVVARFKVRNYMNRVYYIRCLFVVSLLAGCASNQQTNTVNPLTNQAPLQAHKEFVASVKTFGGDKDVFTLSVQNFEDLSGSRSEGGISTSVAASGKFLTEFLLSTPELRHKFHVLNRTHLNALLTERKLAVAFDEDRKTRLVDQANPVLKEILANSLKPKYDFPALEPATYLLHGAVIGYDKAIDEYGQGYGLMGANTKEKTSIDQLYVMVQLIDTHTGEIVSVGTATQRVNSVLTSSGFFGLINPYRILELEGGGVKNDPTTIAFFTALQAAIMEMFENV